MLTAVLLGLSICLVWAPNNLFWRPLPPWAAMFIAATVVGLVAGSLDGSALLGLALLVLAAWSAQQLARPALRALATVCAAAVALALALHYVPGFTNPLLIAGVQLSNDAATFTQYANLDKGAAGFLLLVFLNSRAASPADWRRIVRPTLVVAVLTSLAVIAVALAAGHVRFDPKLPQRPSRSCRRTCYSRSSPKRRFSAA
jgi:hypothetical protein